MYKGLKKNMVLNGSKLSRMVLTFGLLLFGMSCTTLAQQPANERTITINMSASEMLPADLIIFNVNINAEAETPQQAFELHKEHESLLAGLLQDLNISEDSIDYEPIRMNRRQVSSNRYGNEEPEYVTSTNQSVSITFSDFSLYEEIQLTLIENGFDSFSGSFSSTKIAEGKEKALISALQAARERAELIAETSGISLGPVLSINHSDHYVGIPNKSTSAEVMSMSRDASMMDFSQTVEVRANVNISYFIE
ncbi:SIMPL domain-containing protein [Gracilimonas sp.]|uniref:SIMPL domain-containing protein n=1 Tax=Gracilimonas sp. TaxID=1974203 RepID=UPI0028724D07|nr:SIMPL domain-containing protein [Gracilimonas sp.]